jgi:hypothetical protein
MVCPPPNNEGYCTDFSTDDGIIWSSGAASIKDCHVFVDEGITNPKSKNHSRKKMVNDVLSKTTKISFLMPALKI